MRGIEEGWMPKLADPTVASTDLYGSCLDIYNQTDDDYSSIIDEYPDPRDLDWKKYQGWDATDDFVLSDPLIPEFDWGPIESPNNHHFKWMVGMFLIVAGAWYVSKKRNALDRRSAYEELK